MSSCSPRGDEMQEEEGERGRNNRSGERERGGETEGEREKARVRARERERVPCETGLVSGSQGDSVSHRKIGVASRISVPKLKRC